MNLETDVQFVKGVGPYIAKLLAKRNIYTVRDLLYHIPFRYVDRRNIDTISKLTVGRDKTIIGEVVTSGVSWLGRGRKKIFEAIIKDDTGAISAKWFNFNQKYMEKIFSAGSSILLAGEATEYIGQIQFIHPEIEILDNDDSLHVGGKIIPIYPSTENLSQRQLRKIIYAAWEKYSDEINQYLPNELLNKHDLLENREALSLLHFPVNEEDVNNLNERRTRAHKSIIFEEFFLFELLLCSRKHQVEDIKGITFSWSDERMNSFEEMLAFELTDAQRRVIKEIKSDMTSSSPMNRLLQGDVGSGKTIVAVAAAMQAISNGYQAAIMAPTEILAEQHFKNISRYAEELGIPSALITSSVKGKLREKLFESIKNGDTKLVFGTHALIQKELEFNRLGFAVIDEQHRFGVLQRSELHKKGADPDVLVMTATPIPRTLAMTVYGDLDVSILDQLPIGRRPIVTKLYHEKQRKSLYDGMSKELAKGHLIYIVYPLVEESEKVDLKNATEMAQTLKDVFGYKYSVALLHGRMKAEEKEEIMQNFKNGNVHILATTSVVEVGVDVPQATVMIIEHAERFGLSQLHQLRGRVGRSDLQSYCVLVSGWKLSDDARRRLNIMQETTDGFRIAEEDLSIRGPGEFMGTKQSGLPEFHVANLIRDAHVLELARKEAFSYDPTDYPTLMQYVIKRWGRCLELSRA